MSAISEVKKLSKSKWVLLAVGILLGGTVLAGVVAMVVKFVRSKVAKVTGTAPAEAAVQATK